MEPAFEDILDGAVDLYVHAAPDLLPHQQNDLALAVTLKAAGLAGALHRHHFSPTTARAALAASATGFALKGGVVLNDAVGGLNPVAVEVALRSGAVFIGMPTLSARSFREGLDALPASMQSVLGLGAGNLTLLEGEHLRPEIEEILRLVAAQGALLGLGYGSKAEIMALVRAAQEAHVRAVILTYPGLLRLTDKEVHGLVTDRGVWLELCAYGLHPTGPSADPGHALAEALGYLRALGPARLVLSSDGGMAGSPAPPDLLRFACGVFAEAGISRDALRALIRDNPRALLG